jgi:tellurite methyltransferase
MSFDDAWADVVISSAVLHFARDDAHFESMLLGSWSALKPGGLFFCRLASLIGMEGRSERIHGRRHRCPDGAERYLVDEALLGSLTQRLGGDSADPLKTTVVQNQRSLTTWVIAEGTEVRALDF